MGLMHHSFYLGSVTSFAEVEETARLFNETAIGVRRASGKIGLAASPADSGTLGPGDRIITLASDFNVSKAK